MRRFDRFEAIRIKLSATRRTGSGGSDHGDGPMVRGGEILTYLFFRSSVNQKVNRSSRRTIIKRSKKQMESRWQYREGMTPTRVGINPRKRPFGPSWANNNLTLTIHSSISKHDM